jgi:hypothetical protein
MAKFGAKLGVFWMLRMRGKYVSTAPLTGLALTQNHLFIPQATRLVTFLSSAGDFGAHRSLRESLWRDFGNALHLRIARAITWPAVRRMGEP